MGILEICFGADSQTCRLPNPQGAPRAGERTTMCCSFSKENKKGAIFITGTDPVDQIHATVLVLMKLHEGRAGHGLERRRHSGGKTG